MKRILKRDMENALNHVLTVGVEHLHDLTTDCQKIMASVDLSQEEKDAMIETISAQMFQHLLILEPLLPLAWFSLPSDMEFVSWCQTTFAAIKEDIDLDPCVCRGCK